ncbi:hypothetical protein BTO01_03980 [Vibrio jasicida]|uniref:RES family NAD+ phosphorylase n=1 Tax=Vibrio jasicida TaxID=766224 RepID=UPI000CF55054|nr:RES family NAD+ phosphorylase [Vibrio jasicida]PQJ70480.1 hypothetical protein BTO01_03980 [Vibrio jasicida]
MTQVKKSEKSQLIDKVKQCNLNDKSSLGLVINQGAPFFRSQWDKRSSGVFFNPDGSNTRFGLVNTKFGTMYTSSFKRTAVHELLQDGESMTESDVARIFMNVVIAQKQLLLLDADSLVRCTSGEHKITIHDLTTADRQTTQAFAEEVCNAGYDGIVFTSNVSGDKAHVIWADLDVESKFDNGIFQTQSQTSLSYEEIEGKEAVDYLIDIMKISVEA